MVGMATTCCVSRGDGVTGLAGVGVEAGCRAMPGKGGGRESSDSGATDQNPGQMLARFKGRRRSKCRSNLELVALEELRRRGLRRAGHSRQLRVKAEEYLAGFCGCLAPLSMFIGHSGPRCPVFPLPTSSPPDQKGTNEKRRTKTRPESRGPQTRAQPQTQAPNLERDARRRARLGLDLHPLLCLDGLVDARLVAADGLDPPRGLIHDDDLAVAHNVLRAGLEVLVSLAVCVCVWDGGRGAVEPRKRRRGHARAVRGAEPGAGQRGSAVFRPSLRPIATPAAGQPRSTPGKLAAGRALRAVSAIWPHGTASSHMSISSGGRPALAAAWNWMPSSSM